VTHRYVAALTFLLALAAAAPVRADEPPDAGEAPRSWLAQRGNAALVTAPPQSAGATGMRIGAGVVLLALAALASLRALRKQRKARGSVAVASVAVVGSTRVGPKAHAVVVRVGNRLALLGVTDQSVARLGWLPSGALGDAPEIKRVESEAVEPELVRARARGPKRSEPTSAPAPVRTPRAPGFGELLRDALGIGKPASPEPALVLAEATRDVFTSSEPERRRPSDSIDVETQARGLVSRLRELDP